MESTSLRLPKYVIGALEPFIGTALAVAGLYSSAHAMVKPINFYDEGLLLSGANSILLGAVPHADFYTNYPPGVFLIIAAMWKIFGISVINFRLLGLALRVAGGVLAGLVAGRCIGNRFSSITCGLVILWLSDHQILGLLPWPWIAGVVAALLFIWLLNVALANQSRSAWIACGVAWGSLLCIRHDLFVYMSIGVAALAALWALLDPKRFLAAITPRRLALALAAGLLVMLSVWIPVLVRAGVGTVVRDLYFDQVKYVLPARLLPLPPLFRTSQVFGLLGLPACFVERLQGAIVLCFGAPLIAISMLFWKRRSFSAAAVGPTLILSLSILPQVLGRSDQMHAIGSVAPALLVFSAFGKGLADHARGLAQKMGWILGTAFLLALPMAKDFPTGRLVHLPVNYRSRDGGLPWAEPFEPGHAEALSFVAENSSPDEAIFIGTVVHRWVFANAADLYYLANRRGATRYMQFDPNLVNRREVQEKMIRQMEAQRTRVVVLTDCCPMSGEPNASMREGSGLLDDYLAERFRLVRRVGVYHLLLRARD